VCFFIRAIPEGFLGILAVYAFSGYRINIKRFIIASFSLGIAVFMVRFLPIKFGVHTIIALLIHIIIASRINRIDIISSINSSILYVVCLAIGELFTIRLATSLFNMSAEKILEGPKYVTAGMPSLFFVFLVVFGTYYMKKKVNKLK